MGSSTTPTTMAHPGFPIGGVNFIGGRELLSWQRFIKFVSRNNRDILVVVVGGEGAVCPTPPPPPMSRKSFEY